MPTMTPVYRQLRAARLAEQYDRLAHWAVNRFIRMDSSHPDYEDAVQEARLGLLDAGVHFRPELGNRFMTYAGTSLRRRLSLWEKRRRRCGFRATGDCSAEGTAATRPLSLDAFGDETDRPFVELLAGPEPGRDGFLSAEDLERAMRRLPGRDAEVLRARYWDGLTLVEAGERFGVSRGMIFIIEKRAVRKLRLYLGVEAP